MKRIGIDIGTTSVSGAVWDDVQECVLLSQTAEHHAGGVIQNPHRLTETAVQMLDALLDRYPDAVCIGISAQMHGILYADSEGKAMSELYTWQYEETDTETLKEIQRLTETPIYAGYGLFTVCTHARRKMIPRRLL